MYKPKLRNFTLFEEMEFIERDGERFPSFRKPFVHLELTDFPSKGRLAMSIPIENVKADTVYRLQILIMDPDKNVISESDGRLKTGERKDNPFNNLVHIVHQVTDIQFQKEGIHYIEFKLDAEVIEVLEFGVYKKQVEK